MNQETTNDPILNEFFAELKSIGSETLVEVSRKILECPRMLTCLDLNDISMTVRNCDEVDAAIINCAGNEISEQVKQTIAMLGNRKSFTPKTLLVFFEQHNGYSIIVSDIASVQESIQALPSDINIIWGMGLNPKGESEVGLYFIMGYKKAEGVSQNDSGNE